MFNLIRTLSAAMIPLIAGAAGVAAPPKTALAEKPRLITIENDPRLAVAVGKTAVVMRNGAYQPFLFGSARGTLFCQATLDAEPFRTKGKYVYFMRVGTAISRDRGETWTRWTHQENHDDVLIEGGAVQCADGTILMLDTFVPVDRVHHGIGELWKSNDDLRSLNGPFNVDFRVPKLNARGTSNDMGVVEPPNVRLHRSIVEMPNGDLLVSAYGSFAGDTAPAGYLASMMKTRVVLFQSHDHGAHWAYLTTVGVDGGVGTEGYGEPVLVRIARGPHAGRLICIIRTGRELYGSHSDDDGLTWVRPTPVRFPGVDVYDTAKWEDLFFDKKDPNYLPSDEMIGALVDPELIQMQNGLLVCAFGARMPAKKANEGLGRSYLKGPDGKYPDMRPIPGRRYDTWRAPQNGDYLAFSFDGGDTWSGIVQYRSGLPTTHYAGVREIAPDLLYIVYDNSLPKERQVAGTAHEVLGFQLAVKRIDPPSAGR
jgi:hypothetical protein